MFIFRHVQRQIGFVDICSSFFTRQTDLDFSGGGDKNQIILGPRHGNPTSVDPRIRCMSNDGVGANCDLVNSTVAPSRYPMFSAPSRYPIHPSPPHTKQTKTDQTNPPHPPVEGNALPPKGDGDLFLIGSDFLASGVMYYSSDFGTEVILAICW